MRCEPPVDAPRSLVISQGNSLHSKGIPNKMLLMRRIVALAAFFTITLIFSSWKAHAQFEHQLVRRLVVFPMKTEKGFEAPADEAWWQARDEFTRSRRFLVASKQFLIKSDVFQPRAELEPADAIILGKLLDAHALVTFELQGRRLTMMVFDGANGVTLYRKSFGLHPSLTVGDQLGSLTRRVVNDFIAAIPYQGFTVVDSMIGTPVYTENQARLARLDLGITTGAQIGDTVQWIRLANENAQPLFLGGAKTTVIAEGKIIKIEEGIAIAEILRASALKDIREYSLVRVPREADRLRTTFTLTDTPRAALSPELVALEASPMEQIARERRPLVTTLSWVGSLAVFLLLAF